MKTYGRSESWAKTPTLKEYLKDTGGVHPQRSLITRIFTPNKFPTFGLITEHGFIVNVRESTPLFAVLSEEIGMMAAHGEPLYVRVVDSVKATWELEADDEWHIQWSDNDWGYTCSSLTKRKSTEKEPVINPHEDGSPTPKQGGPAKSSRKRQNQAQEGGSIPF